MPVIWQWLFRPFLKCLCGLRLLREVLQPRVQCRSCQILQTAVQNLQGLQQSGCLEALKQTCV